MISNPLNSPKPTTPMQNLEKSVNVHKREKEKVTKEKAEKTVEGEKISETNRVLGSNVQSTMESLAESEDVFIASLTTLNATNPVIDPPKVNVSSTDVPTAANANPYANLSKKFSTPFVSLSGVLFSTLIENFMVQMKTAFLESNVKITQRKLTEAMGETKAQLAIFLATAQANQLTAQAAQAFVTAGLGVIQLAKQNLDTATKTADAKFDGRIAEQEQKIENLKNAEMKVWTDANPGADEAAFKGSPDYEKKLEKETAKLAELKANKDDFIMREYQNLNQMTNIQFDVLKQAAAGTIKIIESSFETIKGAIQAQQQVAQTNSELVQQNMQAAQDAKQTAKDLMAKIIEFLARFDEQYMRGLKMQA